MKVKSEQKKEMLKIVGQRSRERKKWKFVLRQNEEMLSLLSHSDLYTFILFTHFL